MDKGITLDYSDTESVESGAKPYQNSYDNSLRKVLCVEQHIQTLENLKKNLDFCKICNAELKSPMHAKTHYVSAKHSQNKQLLKANLLFLHSELLQDQTLPDWCQIPGEEYKYCKICNMNLLGKSEIDNHCISEQHKRNLEICCGISQKKTVSSEEVWEHQNLISLNCDQQKTQDEKPNEDILSIPQVIISPKLSPNKSPKIKNNLQSSSQQNEMWNCDVCNETFPSRLQFESHKLVFTHVALEKLKIQYGSEIVDGFCSIKKDNNLLCSLCNITMKSLTDTKTHFNGAKHLKQLKMAYKDLFPEENLKKTEVDTHHKIVTNETQETSKEPEINNKTDNKSIITQDIQEKSTECNFFYCYICKLEFNSKTDINVHALSFPHVELAKLKSEIVSLGVPYAEYWTWTHSDNFYFCSLCDAKLLNATISRQHCNGPKHKERLMQWCKEFSTWEFGHMFDPKYFYCKTCDVPLVGTTEAELHYKMKPHLRRVGLYCQICNVPHATEEKFQEHIRSLAHQENAFKENGSTINLTKMRNNMDGQENHNVIRDIKSLEHSSDISAKRQVFIELEKLIHKLYYSKSIPYNISLVYLKKINKDFEELQKNYKKVPESSGKYLDSNLEYETCNANICTDSISDHFRNIDAVNKSVIDQQKVEFNYIDSPISTNSNTSTSNDNSSQSDVKTSKKKRKKKNIPPHLHIFDDTENTGEILHDTNETKENDSLEKIGEQNNVKTSKENHPVFEENLLIFKDTLDLITFTRTEIEKYPVKDNLEIEVLKEIETLVKLVDSGDIPLDAALEFLLNCNKELEHIVKKS